MASFANASSSAGTPANLSAGASSKLLCLQRMLPEFTALGEKAVLVSTSTKMLDLAGRACAAAGLQAARIDGSTNAAVRQQLVNDFNSPHGEAQVWCWLALCTNCSAVSMQSCNGNVACRTPTGRQVPGRTAAALRSKRFIAAGQHSIPNGEQCAHKQVHCRRSCCPPAPAVQASTWLAPAASCCSTQTGTLPWTCRRALSSVDVVLPAICVPVPRHSLKRPVWCSMYLAS